MLSVTWVELNHRMLLRRDGVAARKLEHQNPSMGQHASDRLAWLPVDDGTTIGSIGSEGGSILADEEHELGARITLEEGGSIAPFAITCGIYGWMVHTRFFAERSDAVTQLEQMKAALARVLALIPQMDDPSLDEKMKAAGTAISRFVEQFP